MLFIVPAVGEGAAEKSRLPAPYAPSGEEIRSVLENGDLRSLPVLDAALSLLEEGNPFLWRYNVLTGSSVQPRMPYGVPYLYGGRAESHVFAMAPEYVLQQAWTDSPKYYRTGLRGLCAVGVEGVRPGRAAHGRADAGRPQALRFQQRRD